MPRRAEYGSTFNPNFGQLTEFKMRVFIVLAFVALVRADVGGYNYGAGPSGGSALLSGPIGGGGGGGGAVGGDAPLPGPLDGLAQVGPAGGGGGGTVADLGHEAVPQHDAGAAEVEKEFFTFTAPEAEFDDNRGLDDVSSSLKKSLRVIFIKGPESDGLSRAALNLARSAGDRKTAIYILQKQSDLSHLAQQLQNINQQNSNKPEVHFVKYRTPADAAHAQQAIQQQYNDLGGHSQSYDGGVAPVLNFASKAPVAPVAPSGGGGGGGSNYGQAPASVYIPPAHAAQAPSAAYLPIVKF